ncbi:Norsolorinic acid ketoreductase [Rhypophila decipiens]
MAGNTVYLVTGANRGIGAGIVSALLKRPNSTVIATARDLSKFSSSSSASGEEIAAPGSKVIPFLLDEDRPEISSSTLGARLEAEQGITSLNVVIANAGSSSGFYDVANTDAEGVTYDLNVNAVGVVKLFKAVWPLLDDAAPATSSGEGTKKEKKFVVISSSVGSMGCLMAEAEATGQMVPGVAYGMSKAAVNFFCVRVAGEFKGRGLLVGVLHPGWVKTDMGQSFADAAGYSGEIPTDVPSSAKGILERMDALTPEISGHFFSYDGKPLPW